MKVGIIGAGTMGSGIAQAFAQVEGYEVCLCDINEEFAANGKLRIARHLRSVLQEVKWTKKQRTRFSTRYIRESRLFVPTVIW